VSVYVRGVDPQHTFPSPPPHPCSAYPRPSPLCARLSSLCCWQQARPPGEAVAWLPTALQSTQEAFRPRSCKATRSHPLWMGLGVAGAA
jgi:hypothetical protein